MPWFRYYSEIARDRKLLMAAKDAGISKIEMVGAWSIILCLANDSPDRGKLLVTFLKRFNETDIGNELGTDTKKTKKIITALMRYEMLEQQPDGCLVAKKWAERQFGSDNSTQRVKKHREKQVETPKTEECNVSETLQKRFRNAPDTDTDTESEVVVVVVAPDFSNVFKAYETEIGGLTSRVSDLIKGELTVSPPDWVVDAIHVAAEQNHRSWAYVAGILKRWNAEGRGGKPTGNHAPGSGKPLTGMALIQANIEKELQNVR